MGWVLFSASQLFFSARLSTVTELCTANYFSIRNLRLSKNCRHSVAVWAEMVAGYFGVASPSVRESEFYGMRQKRAVDTKSL